MSLPPNETGPGPVSGLEDRLRGMIVSNGPPAGATAATAYGPDVLAQSTSLPAHLRGASDHDTQDFLARQEAGSGKQPANAGADAGVTTPGRKRLNQAQRRQMNAQLSIPVDSRHVPKGPQSSRGFSAHANPHEARFNGPPSAPLYGRPHGNNNGQYQNHSFSPGYQNTNSPTTAGSHYSKQQSPHMRGSPSTGPRQQFSQQPYQQPFPISPGGQLSPQQHSGANFRGQYAQRPATQNRQLFQPGGHGNNISSPSFVNVEQLAIQGRMLDDLGNACVASAGVGDANISEMEAFRAMVEKTCRDAIAHWEVNEFGNEKFDSSSVELKCFGSMASGFATNSSDMDLALLSPSSQPPPDSGTSRIPRILEKKLLDLGFGARLLTRTRVPIIKLCQRPTAKLLQDLRANHDQWKAGKEDNELNDDDDDDDDNPVEDGIAELNVVSRGETKMMPTAENSGDVESDKVVKKARRVSVTVAERFASFSQKEDESLGDYYSRAKKLLHKLGGKDVHSSHTTSLTSNEIKLMSDLCQSFVDGLFNEKLKARLRLYQSLAPGPWNENMVYRSLSGVYSQVEGERLTMAWEHCPLHLSEVTEINVLRQIENWQKLCDRTDLEPLPFNRYLFQMVEQLRKQAVLQLAVLEQGPSEDPALYLFRTLKVSRDLHSVATATQTDPIVCRQYILGISSDEIRAHITEMISNTKEPSLQFIARRHHVLALAEAYKAAQKAGKYSGVEQDIVQRYIDIITDQPDVSHTSIELGALTSRLSQLSDPLASRKSRPRDRYNDALEFPKLDIGIQCDINFSAQLALHNTHLLRCYSMTDVRVRPMILFIKHWAKVRGINTPYRGSLSSYGYVLMALHYLINVANPFVCPNLQQLQRDPPDWLSPAEKAAQTTCLGKDVRFWRNEKEISNLAQRGMLNHNKESLGLLLRGFFEYYAQNGPMSTGHGRGFDWGREVLSIRSFGGTLTKQSKGWVGARTDTVTLGDAKAEQKASPLLDKAGPVIESLKTTEGSVTSNAPPQMQKQPPKEETKEIRHRYLFAIEDPFELDHNVARTVTHQGIVSIRDEFRRAWRIIQATGRVQGRSNVEGLLDVVNSTEWKPKTLSEVFEDLHGRVDARMA